MKKAIVLFSVFFLLISCATKPPQKAAKPGDLYVDGVNLLKNKKYDDAIKKFVEIRENYPFDPISFVATVKLGDAYFGKREYILAAGVYDDFFNAHPDDENIPYVVTRLGECYERLSLSFDRDQDYTLKAIERYRYVINRFPASSYRKIADERLKRLEQKLADRELYIGEFYYKTYQYNASIRRLEYFLKRYPKAMGTEKALYYLSQSYWHLGNIEKGERYFEVLRIDYPKSIYARAPTMESIRQRKSLKLAKAELPAISLQEKRPREIELKPEGFQVARREDKNADKLDLFDKTKPIDIVSDTMEGFDEEKYVVFKGNVVAKQEDLYIFSDTMEAYVDAETNEIGKAYAKGNVKIVKRERTATCKEALFDNKEGTIVLKGNVIVYSGTDRLTGDTVTYYVNEDRVVVQGAKDYKAHIKITPK